MIIRALPSPLALASVLRRAAQEGSPKPFPILLHQGSVEAQADSLLALTGEAFVFGDCNRIPFAAAGFIHTGAEHLRQAWWLGALSESMQNACAILKALRDAHEDLEREGVRRFESWAPVDHPVAKYQRASERLLRALGYCLEGVHRDVGHNGESIATWARLISSPSKNIRPIVGAPA